MGLFQGFKLFELKKKENKQLEHAGKFVWNLIGSWEIFISNSVQGLENFARVFLLLSCFRRSMDV
jgi:hypothetical protein